MRIDNSIRNAKYSFLAQIANLMVQFVSRTIFIQILGQEYLGLNGLFGNILTILSLADMGIGTVLVYTMYEPLATNNHEKIRQLINIYHKIYHWIASIITVVGLSLTPFLSFFIKDMPDIPNLSLIYILYLANTVVSYIYVYKISIINADQKNYIVTLNQQIFTVVANLAMVIVLLLTHNFFLYLLTQIIFSAISNVNLSRIANKMYPYIKSCGQHKLPKKERHQIYAGAFAMVFHKIGGIVVSGTDNLLISVMVSLDAVGIYSNYLLIINAVKKIISMYTSSILASIGNLTVTENTQKMQTTFKHIQYSAFLITAFCSTCLIALLNPFIQIWLGNDYIFNMACVIAIVATFYIDGMRQPVLCFIDAMGLFTKNKLKPIVESICNLALSIILTLKFGVVGVFLGTVLSELLVCTVWEAVTLYKYGFKASMKSYILRYLLFFMLALLPILCSTVASQFLFNGTIISFIVVAIIASSSLLFLLLATSKTNDYQYFFNLLKTKILHRNHKD